MSSLVVVPFPMAACSCTTVFSNTENAGSAGIGGSAQLAIWRSWRGVRPRRSGVASEPPRHVRDSRDFRTRLGHLLVRPLEEGIAPIREQRIAARHGIAAARVVHLAQALHDERDERRGLPGLQVQREHVAHVSRIEPGIRVDERIPVHVADGRAHARCPRTQHMRGRAVARRPKARVRHASGVLHHRHERVGRIDQTVAAGRHRHGGPPAVVVRARSATPRHLHRAGSVRAVVEAVEVAEVGRVLRRVDGPRHHHAAVQHRRDAVEALGPVVRQAEAAEILIGDRGRERPRRTHLQFQVPEAVERIRAPARGNAPAVLRPRRRVLDVPELAVGGRKGRDGRRAGQQQGTPG